MVTMAYRLDQGDETTIAIRDWIGAETSEIADAVTNLQLELPRDGRRADQLGAPVDLRISA
jgi:hypothetical protein